MTLVVSSGTEDVGLKTVIAVTSGSVAGQHPVVSKAPAAPPAADNKVKTPRWVLSEDAKSRLEGVYQQHKFPTLVIREQLSAELGGTLRQVQVWFQNRRQRDQRLQSDPTMNPWGAWPGWYPSDPHGMHARGNPAQHLSLPGGGHASIYPTGGGSMLPYPQPPRAFVTATPTYPGQTSSDMPTVPAIPHNPYGLPPHMLPPPHLSPPMPPPHAHGAPPPPQPHAHGAPPPPAHLRAPPPPGSGSPTTAAAAAAAAAATAAGTELAAIAAVGAADSVQAYLTHLTENQAQQQQLAHALDRMSGMSGLPGMPGMPVPVPVPAPVPGHSPSASGVLPPPLPPGFGQPQGPPSAYSTVEPHVVPTGRGLAAAPAHAEVPANAHSELADASAAAMVVAQMAGGNMVKGAAPPMAKGEDGGGRGGGGQDGGAAPSGAAPGGAAPGWDSRISSVTHSRAVAAATAQLRERGHLGDGPLLGGPPFAGGVAYPPLDGLPAGAPPPSLHPPQGLHPPSPCLATVGLPHGACSSTMTTAAAAGMPFTKHEHPPQPPVNLWNGSPATDIVSLTSLGNSPAAASSYSTAGLHLQGRSSTADRILAPDGSCRNPDDTSNEGSPAVFWAGARHQAGPGGLAHPLLSDEHAADSKDLNGVVRTDTGSDVAGLTPLLTPQFSADLVSELGGGSVPAAGWAERSCAPPAGPSAPPAGSSAAAEGGGGGLGGAAGHAGAFQRLVRTASSEAVALHEGGERNGNGGEGGSGGDGSSAFKRRKGSGIAMPHP